MWAIVGQYTDKMTQKYVKNESFVRVVTHYGSNESYDSFGFFCENVNDALAPLNKKNILFWCVFRCVKDINFQVKSIYLNIFSLYSL